MSDQGYNKVDLSLDDIIKLNKKEKKQQNQARGGIARGRGGARGRGQGLRGQRSRGVGRGGLGVSPLNRPKAQQTGTISATASLRGQGQGARGRGQRGLRRGVVGSRRGLRGGLTRGSRGGGRGQVTTARGAGVRGGRGNLRVRGARGSFRGTLRGRGSLTNQGQGQGRGGQRQGQGRGAMNRVSLKQKRQMALQALRLAQKTIAQLDQQTARQNFINARRGIIQQQNQQLNTKKNQGHYSSTMSLASTKSTTSLTSTRQLQGTQITTFNPVRSQQSPRGRRRWRPQTQSSLPVNNGSTLTISIDNTTPLSTTDFSTPQVTVPVPAAPQQQRQRLRRRPWRRQNRNNNSNSNIVSSDSVDLRAGASPEFSEQLMNMKPTVSTKYVFEKKAFSTANTSCSLNDRFSGSSAETLIGRKVFL